MIYKDCEIDLTAKDSVKFLKAVSECGCRIYDSIPYTEEPRMIFRLVFSNETGVNKFWDLGFSTQTIKPPLLAIQQTIKLENNE